MNKLITMLNTRKELPKIYKPADFEDGIYEKWEKSGFFNPDKLKGEPYSIMMPPPNVTGVLHLGHALENSLMDIMARYQRMNGKKVLLLPGTDHAAVATQAKVEKVLVGEGMKNPRQELGREKLLEKIRAYAEESKSTILKQIKKMGTSCDWSRLAYTFDEARNRAVNEVFVKMYNDGLIYRGNRVVNWSVKGQSTCSDDELVYIERPAKLYTFRYAKDFPIAVATTRPETKLGDTAVAVNPKDKRYKKYIGKVFTVDVGAAKPLAIKIIADENVDQAFGTGAIGVTPAHSLVDFEMYEKQKVKNEPIGLIKVIGQDGRMTEAAGKDYAGLTVLAAREKFVDWLKSGGLLEKEEEIKQNVGTSDRFGDAIEVLPMTQWFVAVNKIIRGKDKSLKDLMREAVTTGHNGDKKQKVKITPERFAKVYLNWIDNLRDWCISRQIWWGHRIPVYYRKPVMTNDQFSMTKGNSGVGITYFVHGTTLDNEAGKSSGHYDAELSKLGIKQAKELAELIKDKKFDAVFTSDLKRAVDTAKLAFGKRVKIIKDKRLRECDYGKMERKSEKQVQKMEKDVINKPFPGGESYKDVAERINDFLSELMEKYAGKKVAIVAHKAPQLALGVLLNNKTWEQAMDQDWRKKKAWQAGWEYELKELKYIGAEPPKGENWKQDEDTLDTWFSSGLWTFSTLGWPDKSPLPPLVKGGNKDLKIFHPTSWMQMGYEILFFWMARMILMSTYTLNQIPFKDVYIHGMLRNELGKKFSKSSGDNVDPLEIIKKFGTDALRLSLISGIAPGNDSKFYEEKVEGARNIVNKLWNISRYIITNYPSRQGEAEAGELKITNYEFKKEDLTLADKWILGKMGWLKYEISTNCLEKYQFSQAVEQLKDFTWGDLADWYLEASKFEKNEEKNQILYYVLENLLKLWHPFMPFVTEAIWREMGRKNLLMVEKWPNTIPLTPFIKGAKIQGEKSRDFEMIKEIIIAVRNARAENKIEPAQKIKAVIYAGAKKELIESQAQLIKSLRTGISELEIETRRGASVQGQKIAGAIYAAVGEIEIYLIVAVDAEKEKVRLEKEIASLEKIIKAAEGRLANKEFVGKAPAEIVKKEKDKLAGWQMELKKFKEQLKNLK